MTVTIGELRFGKRPGTDNINGSVTVEYIGNVPIELRTIIALAGVPTGYIIVEDIRTWNPGDPPAEISGSILTPTDIYPTVYSGICQVIRTDTDEVLAEESVPDAIEVMQRKVFGHVLDSITGIPMPIVTVTLLSASMTTLTDGSGYFEFADPPFTGVDTITGSLIGFTSNSGDVPIPMAGEQQEVTIYIGPSVVDAEITNLVIS